MLFVAQADDIAVNGQTVLSVAKAFSVVKDLGYKILERHGFKDVKEDAWYPQQQWLDAFREIHETMGGVTLFQIGKKIPDSAKFPPEIDTVEKALAAIDVAYHMNHSRRGKPLFDPATGTMEEGIGHYRVVSASEGEAVMVCDNPYPDEFDRGIIEAMAAKFGKRVIVEVDADAGTRERGREATTYRIRWES